MLEQVDALPGPQAELPIVDRDGQADRGQYGADMSRGIIRAFQPVVVPGLIFRDQPVNEFFQILFGGWVVVLADHERGAGMGQEQVAHPLAYTPFPDPSLDLLGERVQPLAARVHFQSILQPSHEDILLDLAKKISKDPRRSKKRLFRMNRMGE